MSSLAYSKYLTNGFINSGREDFLSRSTLNEFYPFCNKIDRFLSLCLLNPVLLSHPFRLSKAAVLLDEPRLLGEGHSVEEFGALLRVRLGREALPHDVPGRGVADGGHTVAVDERAEVGLQRHSRRDPALEPFGGAVQTRLVAAAARQRHDGRLQRPVSDPIQFGIEKK